MFNKYQSDATSIFKDIVPLPDEHIRLLDWALGLGGEAGEVLDLLKHVIYHKDCTMDKMELAKELGDVLWYVSAIATTCGIDLADVVFLNQVKLKHRFNGKYSAEASANRKANEVSLKETNPYKCLEARIANKGTAPLTVIVVGPDGSGKTTLTTSIAEKANLKRIKCDYRQEDKVTLAKQYLMSESDVIYDRFYYPDEFIYNIVKNIPMSEEYLANILSIFDLLQMTNPVIIYIDADIDTLTERSENWADDYVKVEHLEKIRKLYERWLITMEMRKIPVLRVDTSVFEVNTPEYAELVEKIRIYLEAKRRLYAVCSITGGKDNE